VPNHVHMLHAERAGKYDSAVLDSSFDTGTLTFRPPTVIEIAAEQAGAGAIRVWKGAAQMLLLIALALAARSRRELMVSGLTYLIGEWIGTAAILHYGWQPQPRFAEAAVALALAWLALEMIAFPTSGGRWMLALVFGGFEGMFFSLFIADSGYKTGWVLAGAAFASIVVFALTALVRRLLGRVSAPPRYGMTAERIAACALLVTGATWFVVRLRG